MNSHFCLQAGRDKSLSQSIHDLTYFRAQFNLKKVFSESTNVDIKRRESTGSEIPNPVFRAVYKHALSL